MTGMPDEQPQRLVMVPAHPPGHREVRGNVRFELRQTAGMFGTESATFWAIMPPDGPAGVDGGSTEFDEALTQVLEAIGGLHTQMAAVIAKQGSNLREAYKNYQAAEEAAVGAIDRIMDRGART